MLGGREIDKLEDNAKYKAKTDIAFFCDKGRTFTGKFIKENLPFDVSPNQGIDVFFKKVIKPAKNK